MKVKGRGKGKHKRWFVEGVEPYTVDGETVNEWGPYETKQDAIDDMEGVARTVAKWKPSVEPAEPVAVREKPPEKIPISTTKQRTLFE